MNHKTPFAKALASLSPLPSPRGAALHLIRVAQREEASIDEVVRVARVDPALAGRLIQAANRLRADVWSATGSLEIAFSRLGLVAARQIALGFSIVGEYNTGSCRAFDYESFWTTSLLRGLAARALARFAEPAGRATDPSEAFVLGLLLDVGRLALATAQPEIYATLIESGDLAGASLRAAERERFGIDHGELGAVLMEQWTLPADSVAAVRDYYDPSLTQASSPVARWKLLVAEAIAQTARASQETAQAWTHIALTSAQRAGIDVESLEAVARTVAIEAAEWAPLLRLPVPRMMPADFDGYARAGEALLHPGSISCSPKPTQTRGPKVRILLVDDDPFEHELIQPVLEACGYLVAVANGGDEAIESILDAPPHIVITDWQMPGITGPDLCRALRATRLGERLHLIIRTGMSRDEDLISAIHAGANDFVSKHSPDAVLLARIQAGASAALQRVASTSELVGSTRLAANLAVLGMK